MEGLVGMIVIHAAPARAVQKLLAGSSQEDDLMSTKAFILATIQMQAKHSVATQSHAL
jgi:hypothetical protein